MKKILYTLILFANIALAQTPVSPVQLTTNTPYLEPSTGLHWYYNGTHYLWASYYTKHQVDSLAGTIVSGVSSVFGRTGAITAQSGDYSAFYPLLNGTGATGTWGIGVTGNAGTATKLFTPRAINGVNFDGSAAITITSNTPNSVTFNNGGSGASSGTTFNGSVARTISYNTIGAQATLVSGTNIKTVGGTTLLGSGDVPFPTSLPPSGAAGGDLTGTYPNPTLVNANSNLGVFGAADQIPVVTLDIKGRVTAANTTLVQIAESQVTGLVADLAGKQPTITFGTGVQAALGVNIGSAGAPILFNGAGGTPSSMVGTNITGTATSLNIGGSAATLTTTRTIWGQNFNGSANVTGAMTGVTSLTMSSDLSVSGNTRSATFSSNTIADVNAAFNSNYAGFTGAAQYFFRAVGAFHSVASGNFYGYWIQTPVSPGSAAITSISGYYAGGGLLNGNTVAQYNGFVAESTLISGITNNGFLSNIAAATGSRGFNSAGSALNSFMGATMFGTNTQVTSAQVEVAGSISSTALSASQLVATDANKVLVSAGSIPVPGQVTLTAGVATVTISGLTTSSIATTGFVAIGGTVSTTWQYKAVCTANTLTITAITNAGTTDTTDTSIINYIVTP